MNSSYQQFLTNYKTKKCTKSVHYSTLCLVAACSQFHNKHDERRSPFTQKNMLLYNRKYMKSCSSAKHHCLNLYEYLYHPMIYKTEPCNQGDQCILKILPTLKAELCPYYHSEEQQRIRKQQIQKYQQPKDKNFPQINLLQELNGLFQIDTRKQIMSKPENQQKMNQIKSKLKQTIRNIEDKNRSKKKHLNSSNPSSDLIPLVLSPSKSSAKDDFKICPYQQFTYFHYGENLQIIQDRHHQFKMFKFYDLSDLTFLIIKYVTGFLNSEGGTLYLGVNDESFVHGISMSQKQYDNLMISLDREGRKTIPVLLPQKYNVKRIPVYNYQNRELYVIQIQVKKGTGLTFFDRDCFLRVNASTIKMTLIDYLQYQKVNEKPIKNELDLQQKDLKAMNKQQFQIHKQRVLYSLQKIKNVQESFQK